MHALAIRTGLPVRKTAISTTLAAALFLAGCAMERTPGVGAQAPACRINSVLVCDLAPHAERCHCLRHSDFRDLLRSPARL